jgi:hypothetical protein
MSKPTKSDILKKELIKALEKALGVVTTACKNVGVARSTFYDWYNADEQFKKDVDGIGDIALDFAESQLHRQIKDGNTSATIFYLKTKGKRRGYYEKSIMDITSGEEPINIPPINWVKPDQQE